jgi:hypothetical protein
MATIETFALAVTTTGSDAAATGTAVSPVFTNGGEVLRVYWDYHASAPNTTDATLYDTGLGATLGLIDGLANSVTDAVRYPRVDNFTNTAGASLSANEQTEPYLIPAGSTLTAALAGSNALTNAAICYVLVRRF